jgi:threonine dehydrogenase-like Zn-dependent dehydrogenase
MRAVVLRDGALTVRETADPVPGPGELLLRTLSTAICASDVHFMDHPEMGIDDPTGRSLYDPDRDIVMGHEFVGEVVGHGPDCSDQFPVGARVTSMPVRLGAGATLGQDIRIIGQHPEAQGSFGELLVVPELLSKVVTGDVADDAVALVDAFAVGEFYVRVSGITPGQVPIVVGAGAVGLSAVAALAGRGIEPIIVSDPKAERRELATRFGAHVAIDPTVQPPYDTWTELIAERGLAGPPFVFECVGLHGLVQQLVDEAPFGPRIYAAGGWYTGDSVNCTSAARQGALIQFGGGPQPEDWYGTLDAVCEGRLDPLPSVGKVIGLDEVPGALELARRSEGPPRIVVHPNG